MKTPRKEKIRKREIPGFTLIEKEDHYRLRKIGLTRERVRIDPAFIRTRLEAKDFSRALHLAQSMINELDPAGQLISCVHQLAGVIRKAMNGDTRNSPGRRNIVRGNGALLKGFEFNKQEAGKNYTKMDIATKLGVDRKLAVTWPAHIPALTYEPPGGCTQVRWKAKVMAIDTAHHVHCTPWQQTSLIPCKHMKILPQTKWFDLTKFKLNLCVVVVFGQWYKIGDGIKGPACKIFPGSMYCCDVQFLNEC